MMEMEFSRYMRVGEGHGDCSITRQCYEYE